MKYIFSILLAVGLVGCTEETSGLNVEWAHDRCLAHNGTLKLEIDSIAWKAQVECKDGSLWVR
jgi:hypothetical protein